MQEQLIIIGIGASAKQVYDFNRIHELYNVIGFAVDKKYIKESTYLNLPVFELETLKEKIDSQKVFIFVALGWNRLNSDRRSLYERLKSEGYRFANLISPNAIIRGRIEGDNCWVNDYAVMQSDSVLKDDVILREHVVIGHEAVINSHVFVGIRGLIAGGCDIGEQTFVGINATVFEDTKVGEKCIIGGCAVVKRNVPAYTACKTNIENTIVKFYGEEIIESKLVASKNVR